MPAGPEGRGRPIPARYQLVETSTAKYHQRTRQNVADSDGTLILTRGAPDGGTALTRQFADLRGKPCLVVDLAGPIDLTGIRRWIDEHQISTLNVAGPRESNRPGIEREAFDVIAGLVGS